MGRDEVMAILRKHQEAILGYGVKSLAIFGSVARDEAKLSSDVDILVEFEGVVTFDCYMDLKFYLEDNLGTKVDLVSRKMLKSQIRENVEQEAIHVA
jgi:hypothetical protein